MLAWLFVYSSYFLNLLFSPKEEVNYVASYVGELANELGVGACITCPFGGAS